MTIPFIEPWILASLAAALLQTVRFMLQKVLATATLTSAGATFSRFVYALPVVVVLVLGYLAATASPFPKLGPGFWTYGSVGAVAQIIATICVVALFKARNFAVGITFKKTEVILTAVTGAMILGDRVSSGALVAILLGVLGLLLLSGKAGARGLSVRDLGNRAAGLGIASGAFFAVSAVSYRGASLEVASEDALLRAGVTLLAVVAMQTALMLLWLRLREPGEIGRVWAARRVAVWIGLTSMAGSLCWFIAFTLQNAAYVKALGQVELVFSVLASTLFFRERITGREALGMAVLIASILLLVLVA